MTGRITYMLDKRMVCHPELDSGSFFSLQKIVKRFTIKSNEKNIIYCFSGSCCNQFHLL